MQCPDNQPIPDSSLITVFHNPPNGGRITLPWLQQRLEEYRKDDVFDNEFLANLIFFDAHMTGRPIGDPDAEAFLAESGTIAAYFFNNEIALAPGPYMKLDGQLWEVCRLVDDSYETCMVALKPQEKY